MEILLNPNVAYLCLVATFLFVLLSLISPGTGFLEVAALFTLLPAGYAIYTLPVNFWALALVVLALVPFLFAVRRSGRTPLVILSIILALVGSIFLFREDNWQPAVHPALATLVSLFLIGFLWLISRKSLEAFAQKPAHNLQDLIGAVGETRSTVHQEGSVYVMGELWSAHSQSPIPTSTPVRVISREGFILEVEPVSTVPVAK